jgi:hypothetical protein
MNVSFASMPPNHRYERSVGWGTFVFGSDIPLSLTAVSGMTSRTSQCSTILPFLVEPGDADARVVVFPRRLKTVQDRMFAIGAALKLKSLTGVLGGHPLDVLDERHLPSATPGVCCE